MEEMSSFGSIEKKEEKEMGEMSSFGDIEKKIVTYCVNDRNISDHHRPRDIVEWLQEYASPAVREKVKDVDAKSLDQEGYVELYITYLVEKGVYLLDLDTLAKTIEEGEFDEVWNLNRGFCSWGLKWYVYNSSFSFNTLIQFLTFVIMVRVHGFSKLKEEISRDKNLVFSEERFDELIKDVVQLFIAPAYTASDMETLNEVIMKHYFEFTSKWGFSCVQDVLPALADSAIFTAKYNRIVVK